MKHLTKIMMLILVSIMFFSCENSNISSDEPTLSNAEKTRIVKLLEADFSAKSTTPVKFSSEKIIEVDGVYCLRSFHGKKVTTTLLKIDANNKLIYDGVSCTSTACSNSTTGCWPSTSGCSKCLINEKDCTRTVTIE